MTVPYLPAGSAAPHRRIVEIVASHDVRGHHIMLVDAKVSSLAPKWVSGIHRHEHYEVDIIFEGHGYTATPPAQQIGAGTVVYHPPHQPHAWHVSGAQACRVLSLLLDIQPGIPLRAPLRWPVWPDFVTDAHLLLGEVELDDPAWLDRFALRLAVIVSRVLSLMEWPEADAHERPAATRCLEALDGYLRAHLHLSLTLDEIAGHLCVSRRTLTRMVRSHTNGSVMDRLRMFRMTRAAELLWQTNLSVAEIAEQVGFSQESYFCRSFRQYFHTTPLQYKRQMLATRAGVVNLFR
ncbi:MAG: helix-turn-helix transcriptional regulator [Armatimonadota bacterium]